MSVDSAKKSFNEKVNELSDASSDRSLFLDNERYEKILREVKEAQILRKNNQPLTSKHYRRLRRYDVMKIGDTEKLIEGGSGENDDSNIRYYCKTDELFDVLETAHIHTGHKRTRVMEAELKKKYCNVTRQVIDLFLTLCEHCQMKRIKREGAKSGQKQQAQKMVSLSNSRLPAVDIGTNVVVRVPDVDRGRLVFRNVLAVVVDVDSSGLYQLGTKEGLLERLYARNELTTADNFIDAHDVPSGSLSLRSASMITSGSKQGFVSCNCKRYCIDKKCKCHSKNIKCNSKCHSNSSCKNK